MPYRTFTLEQVANYLHIPPPAVRELAHHGEIPCERQGGRLLFRKPAIDAWASQRILGMKPAPLADYHRQTTAQARHEDDAAAPVRVGALLLPEWNQPRLPARTRASVLRELAAAAERTGLVNDPATLLASLREREELCSTGLPGGLAIPHPRQHDPYLLAHSFILLARTPQPIPFGAPDGKQTDLFFLICCASDRIHLHVLARLCLLSQQTSLLVGLRACDTGEGMAAAVERAETALVAAGP
ncbi:MAG: PTS sugar transporter subunit IIA [Lentisphaeria bacterium]|jgi:excisionase family DNA binding protein